MRAIVCEQYGNSEQLTFQTVPKPEPNSRQLLIKIHACSVNPVDWKILRGDLKIVSGRRPTRILGGDFAGTVAAVGSDVASFAAGDEVWGHVSALKGGAYAEYILVEENNIDAKPAKLSFEEAASVPLAGLTAYQGLVDRLGVTAAEHVLINGCTGGVGTFAVQIAKALGCKVTGICSEKNADMARELGCDEVIDYAKTNVLESGLSFDAFYDAIGNIPFGSARAVLKETGRYVTVVPTMFGLLFGARMNIFRKQAYHSFMVTSSSAELAVMRKMVETGKLKPVVQTVYPMSKVQDAHQQSISGRTVGKIVLRTAEDKDWP